MFSYARSATLYTCGGWNKHTTANLGAQILQINTVAYQVVLVDASTHVARLQLLGVQGQPLIRVHRWLSEEEERKKERKRKKKEEKGRKEINELLAFRFLSAQTNENVADVGVDFVEIIAALELPEDRVLVQLIQVGLKRNDVVG